MVDNFIRCCKMCEDKEFVKREVKDLKNFIDRNYIKILTGEK